MVGIQETKEALMAVDEIGLELVRAFKDGVQYTDFIAFWSDYQNNPDLQAKLKAGFDKYQQIPEEIKDIDLGEAVELVAVEVAYVPKFIEALKA